jgi:site-specific DNA recombinase
LIIKSEYQFDESSLKDKRTKFEQVIKEIEKSKTKIALIVETVDRLQRGFKESVLLDDLRKSGKLELHFIRENLIIHKDSNSSEIQRWDLAVFVAKSYVLQISDNVKRTNEKMIANGKWIGKAPVGYMNTEDENSRRETIVDPVRSPYVIKMFELYATGNYSMRKIKEKMDKVGLRSNTKHPRPMAISMINNLLNNPFYYGMMLCKGKLYPHKYPPLISKHLFDKVQQIKAGWHKKPFKYASKPYILRGMIKCADCGCTITPETSKGHIYYSCTNYHKVHKKRVYVKENELLEPIYGLLDGIQLSDEQIKELVDNLKQIVKNKNDFLANSLLILRKEYDKLSNRLSKLQDDKYDGCITNDLYNQKFKEYTEKQDKVMNEMNRHNIADKEFYITANTVLNLAQRAR